MGSSDDVSADSNGQQLLFLVACNICLYYMAYMGSMCIHISWKVLGKQQYGTQMLGMYGQSLRSILKETKEVNKFNYE